MRWRADKCRERAFATLIVMMVLALLTALILANARLLSELKAEILLIEKRHDKRWEVSAGNPPARSPDGADEQSGDD